MSAWGNLVFTITTLGELHFGEVWEAAYNSRDYPEAISVPDQMQCMVLDTLMKNRDGLTAIEISELIWEIESDKYGNDNKVREQLDHLIERAIGALYKKNSIEIEGETEDEVYQILAPGTRSQKIAGVFEVDESKNIHKTGEIANKEIETSVDMRRFPINREALDDLSN